VDAGLDGPGGVCEPGSDRVAGAEGTANTRIAELVDTTVTTVLSWRYRYQARGLDGLVNAKRSGRPRTLDHRAIVAETLTPPPKKKLG
jgi:transposase